MTTATDNHQTTARLRLVYSFWENQHPLARLNVYIALLGAVVAGGLFVIFELAPRYFSYADVLELVTVERLWFVMSVVLLVLMAYNAIRVIVGVFRQDLPRISIVLALLSTFLMGLLTLNMPSVFESTVSYAMGRPYDEVFDTFRVFCDGWTETYEADNLAPINVDEDEDIESSIFANNVQIWGYPTDRRPATVFFNYGDEKQPFGLACVLREDTPPHRGNARGTGGSFEDYNYEHIQQNYYRFIERKSNENE